MFEVSDVSELRSAIEAFRADSLPELPDARLEEDFAELQSAVELMEAECLRRLAEIDRRRLYERDGHLSAVAWLASRFKVAWGTAREHVRIARGLVQMPGTRSAFEAGDVSWSAVRALVAARDIDPAAFERSETTLVDAARIHSMQDLQRVTAYWRQQVEQERETGGEDTGRDRRRLHASVSFLGMVRVDGDLDPETGETLLTALRAVIDADSRWGGADERTPTQRRADALGEICRQWLDRSDRPIVAGERPHLTVTVSADALAREGTAELDHAGAVSSETARRLACDASVRRVVLSARSEPIDVGRRTPVVSAAMRRAVIVRDRQCRFPGCDRPDAWCDAHHVVHWADGGRTTVSNLVLLCRRHHRKVHERNGFRLEFQDGLPVFRRPDGSLLAERAPP